MIAACEWAPAHNVYTGTPAAAIHAFAEIPLPARLALIERTKKANSYDDIVTISRNSIAGSFRYAPDVTSMHFGSKKRMCATVSRSKWRDSETQLAMVYCESGHCVIRPAVCNNWAIVYRLADEPGTQPVATAIEESTPQAEPLHLLALPVGQNVTQAATFDDGAGTASLAPRQPLAGSIPGPVALYPGQSLPTISPVPEPAPLWLLLAGFGFVALWRKYK